MSTKTIDNAKSPKANKPGTDNGADGKRGQPYDSTEVNTGEQKPIDPTLLPIGDPAGAA